MAAVGREPPSINCDVRCDVPKTRNIVKSVRVEKSVGARKCHANSRHSIKSGDLHLAYDEIPGQRQNICMKCAKDVLDVAEKHLAEVRDELGV
jgi:hypothetical protein